MNHRLATCTGIRAARAEDIPALLALEAEFPTDRLTRAHWRHLFSRGKGLALVFCADDVIVGDVVLFFRKNAKLARVYSLVVHPKRRGQGIASRLMDAAHAAVRQRGLAGLTLEVRVDNQAAQALYARLGYRLDRRLHGFYEDGSDALRLTYRFAVHDAGARVLKTPDAQREANA